MDVDDPRISLAGHCPEPILQRNLGISAVEMTDRRSKGLRTPRIARRQRRSSVVHEDNLAASK